MPKSATRPVYLNLLLIRQPIGAIVSIVHRITGAVMCVLIPFALCALQKSLASPEGFAEIKTTLSGGIGHAAALLALWFLVQHLYSGIRHLLLDIDIGIDLNPARAMGWVTFVASVATVAIVGALL